MKRILVVDDNPDILEAILMILETQGYSVVTTTQSLEAFAKIKESLPDLVVLDVLLSGSDGRAVCKALKENNFTKDIPVLIISAHPSAEATIKYCGADAFISKPFSMDKFLSTIKRLLDNEEEAVPDNLNYGRTKRYKN